MKDKRKHIAKKIRDKLLVDAMHRCCLCPQHEDITDIHHILPISEGGPNTENNLMVVCPTCHAKIRRIRTMYNSEQLKMYKERWVSLCSKGLTFEECLKEAPGITIYLPPSLHNQTPLEPNFVGREEYLDTITEWYKKPQVRIGALIGWGGVGKSALVRKWYDELEANKIRPDGIFWWGFYRNAFLEQFLNALLRYIIGGQIEPDTIKSTWEKVDRIKEYIGQGAYLIILDGLEQMQKGRETGEQFGCMEHRECSDMLKFISDTEGDGLCLITTRYPLTNIKNYQGTVFQTIEVERLSTDDARSLFKKVGVKGNQEEIDSVIVEYDGYALSLTLLSKYLVEDFGGNIKKAKEIPPFYSDKEAGGKAHRILLWYAKQLSDQQQPFMKIFSI
jgi:GTPase SAR1 family protein